MAARHCDADTLRGLAHGTLDSAESAQARSHLGGCAACARALAELDPLAGETMVSDRIPQTGEARHASTRRTLEPGTRIDRYVILERLGSGGMGEIYAAYDPGLDRKIALKLMRMDVLSAMGTHSGKAKLLAEAKALARLNHPNVVAVHDVGEVGEEIFIAMELVEGDVLRDWLEATPRTTAQVLEVFKQAGRGLTAAHAVGLVHRDFKPLNVIVGRDGRARVVDFGLARTATTLADTNPGRTAKPPPIQPGDETPTIPRVEASTMMLSGTPAYMSPEQLNADPTDARTDQFSFAVSLYEALAGQRPFKAEHADELPDVIARGPAPARGIPAWIQAVLVRGLSYDREARFPGMDAMLAALEKDPSARRRQRWGMAGVALAAAAVVAGAAAARFSAQQRCAPPQARWAGVWDGARRADLRAAFARTDKPFAAAASDAVDRALDRYRQSWLSLHQQACLATLDGAQARDVLQLQTECLDRRLVEARELVEQLARADEGTVKNAARAVSDLQPLSDCADEQALRAGAAWPVDPSKRAEVEAVRAKVAELRALLETGHLKDAVEAGEKAAAGARLSGYKPLEAEAELLVAKVRAQRYEFREAVAAEHRAAAAGQATGQSELVEQAWTLLVRHTAMLGGESDVWVGYAEALLNRLPGDTRHLRAMLLKAEAAAETQKRRYEKARELARQSLELVEQALGKDDLAAMEALGTMASASWYLGDLDAALSTSERASAIGRLILGPDHPTSGDFLRDQAGMLLERGDYEEAVRRAAKAEEIYLRAFSPDAPPLVTARYHRTQAMAYLELERGEVRGQPSAEALARETVRSLEAAKAEEQLVFTGQVMLAAVLQIRGRCRDALPTFEKVEALLAPDASTASDQWDLMENRERLGACLLATGAPARARTPLESSVKWFADNGTKNLLRGEGLFLLAQAEWATGAKGEARRDAESARGLLPAVSPRGKKLVPEVDRWMAAHAR
ncbi:MAG TPA: serine/threonine-protein kinase [Myxococcaceae bacterium]|nr:serine/threonine-protein kinase [Myxococcaceae bacterium]